MQKPKLYSPIIWVSHEYKLSGANFSLLEFMKVLSEAGAEQILVVHRNGPMQEAAEALGIKVHFVKFYPWVRQPGESFWNKNILRAQSRNIYAVFQLLKIIRKYQASLIVSSTSTFNVGAWASILAFKKHFWRISEFGELDFGFHLAWNDLSYKFMNLSSAKILLNSKALFAKYSKFIDTEKLKIVYNPVLIKHAGINHGRFLNPAKVSLLILGQVRENKGHLEALHAVKYLIEQNEIVYLTIAGGTPDAHYLTVLKAFIQQYHLEQYISFVDFTSDVETLMAEHDILLMCSRAEAFGRVTAEAMKRGLPVIGTRSGGTVEMIEHNVTGLLYEPGNAVQLAKEIKRLYSGEADYKILVNNAYIKINGLTDTRNLVNTFLHT